MKNKTSKDNRKAFYFAAGLILILLSIAVLAPVLSPNDPYKTNLAYAQVKSSEQFPLGTDALGRCMLSRILYGARISIFSSTAIILTVFSFGTIIGGVSAYFGGIIDTVLTKFITVMQAFPKIILALAIAGLLGIGIQYTIIALCLVEWTEYARLARSLTFGTRQHTYIKAARVCGETHLAILFRRIIPNIISPLIVNASLGIASMIMEIAALSYLGAGVKEPMAEWGAMMNTGRNYLQTDTRLVLIPGLAIFITAAIFNLFGEKLRDRLN